MPYEEQIRTRLCVIGGGMAGICAAVAAARRGLSVVLISDRPVLGGNASSEVRMWIRGAANLFPAYREGGIVEEIAMRNTRFNPEMNYAQWGGVLYGIVTAEKNLRLILNATCLGASVSGNRITEVECWQLTTYKRIKVYADYFADCSGDSILAEFTGAQIMKGREGHRLGEKSAVEGPDEKTMGNSCLIQARETDRPVAFTPPPFTAKLTSEQFRYRMDTANPLSYRDDNFWWIELGGERDTLRDAEEIQRELIAIAYGVWDYIKNSGKFDSANWELDWVGYLPAKRESRRYRGDVVLTENDITGGTAFPDEVAYGGWPMDDHNPLGFASAAPPNRNIIPPAPYPIPYRSLYSVNIANLWFAGRNISVSHIALSSTRVMATCAATGQAVGTACAIAAAYSADARGVNAHIGELKQALRDDDCYLLNTPRRLSDSIAGARTDLEGGIGVWLNGLERDVGSDQAVTLNKGQPLTFTFDRTYAGRIRLLFDNDIARSYCGGYVMKMFPQRCNVPLGAERAAFSPSLVKSYTLEVLTGNGWRSIFSENDNWLRLKYVDVGYEISGIRFTGTKTYGADKIRLLSVDITEKPVAIGEPREG